MVIFDDISTGLFAAATQQEQISSLVRKIVAQAEEQLHGLPEIVGADGSPAEYGKAAWEMARAQRCLFVRVLSLAAVLSHRVHGVPLHDVVAKLSQAIGALLDTRRKLRETGAVRNSDDVNLAVAAAGQVC
eukprot:GHVU01205446.1.p2 GENE.GHVU01205446.1~~GHVU01205446.1.p2  ORF type:complete len:131 (+),score=16.22 GHVU01205446.1:255-647(+)